MEVEELVALRDLLEDKDETQRNQNGAADLFERAVLQAHEALISSHKYDEVVGK